nr:hypothetical protein [Tanacetum cinerariifolium]
MSTRSSAKNLFPPLDNLELTIQRRSRADPTLLNDFEMAAEGNNDLPVPDLQTMKELCQPSLNGRGGPIASIAIQAMNFGLKNDNIQQSIKVNGVTDDALHLYLFLHSLTHHAIAWFDRLPRNSINTFEQMAKMFLGKYFPPSMVTKLKNEITNFRQHTFYNGLTLRHRDTINAAAGGTFMKRCLEECYDLIENMTVHYNDWDTSAQWSESSSSITSSSDTKIAALKAEMAKINKNLMRVLQVNQQVKAVTLNCKACGGPHSFSDCPATIGQTQNVYAAGAHQDPLINHHCCYKCENSLNDFFCHQCTCEFCGNGAHVGYNCPAQVPSFQTLPSFPQQYPCCEDCGDLFKADHCQPPQYTVNHPIFNAHNDLLNSRTKLMEQITSIMGDEHLNTIPATESDEFVKSCVENLIPNPSESKGENGCDVPACFTTFSNVLFDADYEFDSRDDQSLYDEDIISSSKIDSLLDEFADELTLLKSIPPRIDETDCDPEEDIRLIEILLYDNSSSRPSKEFVSENSNADIESFSPSLIPVKDNDSFMEEIDLSFTLDDPMPSSIEEDDYDSERDILILEELLDNYSLSLPENESFHFDIPSFSRPPVKPPDGNTGILNVKIMGDISDQKVLMPRLTITRVLNQEKSPDLLPHQGLEIF